MSKVKDNLITEGFSGKLGKKLVFRKMRDGRTLVSVMPDFSDRVFSEGQLAHQSRFQKASAYAKVAAKTQPIYAELAAQTRQPAYNIALADWFHPPVIEQITRQADQIRVYATDDVQVAKVCITVLDEEGRTLEQAEARPAGDGCWEYGMVTDGHVLVEAFDLAGNVTRQEL